jgi:ATP-dependent Lon protease
MDHKLSSIWKKITLLDDKLNDIEDTFNEHSESITDLYDSINNIKTYDNDNQDNCGSEKKSKCNINKLLQHIPIDNKDIVKTNLNTFLELLHLDITINKHQELIQFFINLHIKQQAQYLDVLQNNNSNTTPKLFQLLDLSCDDYAKRLAISKFKDLEKMSNEDSEYFKLKSWIDNLIDIPFGKYKKPGFMDLQNNDDKKIFLDNAQICLDKLIYGQKKTKNHVIEIIGKMMVNNQCGGSCFGIYGQPGTGKTTLVKGLGEILGLPVIFISLGGLSDVTYLNGSHYTYIGSCVGRIISGLKQNGCMNPIFYFDELDKVSTSEKGEEIINLLIHLTDPVQNNHFIDQYMDGISIDLSRSMFIFSFNNYRRVNPILLDRLNVIKFHNYTESQKIYIARHYIIPNIVKEYQDINICIHKNVLLNIVKKTSSIRTIKKKLEKIISRLNICLLKGYQKKYINIKNNGCNKIYVIGKDSKDVKNQKTKDKS